MTRSVLREAERTLRRERKAEWDVNISRYDRVTAHQDWEVKRKPRCLMKGQGSYLVQDLEMNQQADHDRDLLRAADQGSTECHACNRRSCPGTFPRNGPRYLKVKYLRDLHENPSVILADIEKEGLVFHANRPTFREVTAEGN
ncbi:hypothetical protein RvY_17788 [Ramazzottius varieornatus]|uniref:Uncharacterized protein n=1 Tax=Ramazzottius varieornatus TaxID=947166 RepID=A0A1D1W3E3_RAMVA|nr:hypothetical protein RvY_17788 [Ramazzottius varieornatus]